MPDALTLPDAPTMPDTLAVPDASLDLASLLCARLCHDLTSPVGALANGLELLADETDPELRQRYFALLEQGARDAEAKLRFFRVAFGGHTGQGSNLAVPVAEIRPLIEALARDAKPIAVNWLLDDETLPMAATKVLLNLALIGMQALVRGGSLDCGAERTAQGCDIVVRASAPRLAFGADIGRAIDGSLPSAELTSRTAAAAMVRAIVAAHDGSVQHLLSDDALLLGASLVASGPAA